MRTINYKDSPFYPNINMTYVTNPFYPKSKTDLIFLDSFVISVTQDDQNEADITVNFASVPNAQMYRLYIDGVMVSMSNMNIFNHSFTKNGEYAISVRAFATGYRPSKSNEVVVVVDCFGGYLYSGLRFITNGLKRILLRK